MQLAIKQAALDAAKADLVVAQASVRGQVAQARSARYKLQHTIEDVDNKVALLRANAAALAKSKSSLVLAQQEFDPLQAIARHQGGQPRRIRSTQEHPGRSAGRGESSDRECHPDPREPGSSRQARGWPGPDRCARGPQPDFLFRPRGARRTCSRMPRRSASFPLRTSSRPRKRSKNSTSATRAGMSTQIYATVMKDAPVFKQAQARLLQAQHDLEQAQLNLRYCDVVSEIDGVVTRRNVNPGNNVQAGQSLMAVRSLTEVWIDANFKETQLSQLRIGQPVDLRADMYGKRQTFKGRISASPWAPAPRFRCCPRKNATGNFVKVVQRPARAHRPHRLPSRYRSALRRHLGGAGGAHQRKSPRAPTPASSCSLTSPRPPPWKPSPWRPGETVSAATLSVSPAAALPAARRTINPWLIALAVVVPTFMEVLDTTIANVALRYIAGGLSAPATDSEWVITSYLAANAIILPISAGWPCGSAGEIISCSPSRFSPWLRCCAAWPTSLGMLIASRVLQGLAGGGLQPSSQGVLLDAFPPEKQGAAQTLFGIAALLAPVVGPTLGGYITDNYGWRWIFYLNLPVGAFALWMCSKLVHDPPYLKAAKLDAQKKGAPFDTLGLCLLSLTMVTWKSCSAKARNGIGLAIRSLRVQTLASIFVLALGGLVWREMRIASPLINFRTLADRNFRWCCIIIFCAFASLYANTTSLPALLQSLFGYDATTSGLVLSPRVSGGPHALCGGTAARARRGCALPHRRRPRCLGNRQLLDVAFHPRHRPLGCRLVSYRFHHGTLDDLRSAQRRGLSAHPAPIARRRGGPPRFAAQRRGQCGHFRGADHSRAARSIPHPAPGREPRSPESGGERLPRPGPGQLPPAQTGIRRPLARWRSSRWRISVSSNPRRSPTSILFCCSPSFPSRSSGLCSL